MDFEAVHKYIEKFSSDEDELLAKINRETWLKVLNPRMVTGPVQGKFLQFISQMISPKYILELGTFTGYSAICMAKGLKENGQLHTIEKNDEVLTYARKNFAEAGLSDKIRVYCGDAGELLPTLNYNWDIVFLDADKIRYGFYYDLLIDKLKPGAIILADNVLWNGKVLTDIDEKDKDTIAIQLFNEKVQADTRVENVIIPLRDGLAIIRKL